MDSVGSYDKVGIQSNAERYSWAAYHIFVLLSTLIGDSLILYASFQKDIFKLNSFLVIIIKYIVVFDITYAVSSAFPIATSLVANSWVLGDFMCYARAYLGHLTFPTGMYLVALLTTSKMLFLKYPTRISNWTPKRAHLICCFLSFITLPSLILHLIIDSRDIKFDYRVYDCDFMHTSKVWIKLRPALTIFSLFVPNIIIISTTIPTLMYLAAARKSAKRVRGSVPWQGALTVALTAIMCFVSNVPTIASNIWSTSMKDQYKSTGKFEINLLRVARYILFLNIVSNVYIYALAISSFRRFLRNQIFSILSKFTPLHIRRQKVSENNL